MARKVGYRLSNGNVLTELGDLTGALATRHSHFGPLLRQLGDLGRRPHSAEAPWKSARPPSALTTPYVAIFRSTSTMLCSSLAVNGRDTVRRSLDRASFEDVEQSQVAGAIGTRSESEAGVRPSSPDPGRTIFASGPPRQVARWPKTLRSMPTI
jgi:hypothetical protein